MSDGPLLSVVVPIYNVGSYLRPCLDSLLSQAVSDLEIICVDDGSTDGSGAVADEYAAHDSRLRVVHVENGGLGKARNIGTELAHGRYLAFVDADDRVTLDGYDIMCSGLERSGSDFATGAVDKFTETRRWRSPLHATAILGGAQGTHISKMTSLVNDTTAWNKVFRRSFWDRHHFEFPVGVLYEDIPVTIPAHVLAERVDVTTRPVYEWRERGDGSMSITQRRDELKNLQDRLAAVESVTEFLDAHASTNVIKAHDLKVLTVDVPLYLAVLDIADEDYQKFFGTHMQQFLRHVDRATLSGVPIWDRVAYELLARGRVAETVNLLQIRKSTRGAYEVKRRRLDLYAQLPYLGDRSVGVPDAAYAVTNDLPVRAAAERVEIRGNALVVRGYALMDKVPLHRPWSAVRWLLVHDSRNNGFRLVRPVLPRRRPDITADRGQPNVGYDWAGFEARIPLRKLPPGADGKAAIYAVQIKVATPAARRGVPLPTDSSVAFVHRMCLLPDGTHVAVSGTDELRIAVTRTAPVLRDVQIEPDSETLRCVVDLPQPPSEDARMIWRSTRDEVVPLLGRLVPESDGNAPYTAEFPLADFQMLGPGRERRAWHAVIDDDVTQSGEGKPAGALRAVVVADDFASTRWQVPAHGRELVVLATPTGRLELSDRRATVRVERYEWKRGELRVELTLPQDLAPQNIAAGEAGAVHISLRHSDGAYLAPGTIEPSGEHLIATFGILDVPVMRSIKPGTWGLQVREGDFAADRFLTITISPESAQLAGPVVGTDQLSAQVLTTDSRLRVRVRSGREEDRGAFHQVRLRTGPYLAATELPLRDTVLFQTWGGKQYSGSPRAVYEELRRRDFDRTCLWVRHDTSTEMPADVRSVLLGSREYYEALATARYVIANDLLPDYYRKRAGATYVQTWHGTPLKRIGSDVVNVRGDAPYLDELAADVRNWDRLLSPSPYATEILHRALGFDGAIAETGAPANDVFFAADADERARAVRARLGLSADQRVLLWAPTWRDDQRDRRGRYELPLPFDLATWEELLGPDDVLLFRGHHLVEDTTSNRLGGLRAVRNVTSYPDVQDLCLIADVLISDYSSIFVDFANTRRPMICYAWDLDVYRDKVRGFYIDFESDFPGPVVTDLSGLHDALASVGTDADERYDRFVQRFCPLDDGRAAERVVTTLFEPRGV